MALVPLDDLPKSLARGIVPEDDLPNFSQQSKEPTESGGFFGSLGTALKERVETALPAAKLYTGLGSQEQATEELLKAKEHSEQAYKQTEFSDIGDAFKAGNYVDALGKTVDKFKEVAGSSLGAMGPAMVAGAGAAGAAAAGAVALPAAAVGTAAFGVVALGSYIADNIGRQKEELNKAGDKYADVDRLSATAAAAGQTALDVFGFKFFKPLGALVGLEGKATAEKAAMEIVEAATKPNAYRRAVLSGAAKGIAFEVPQEVAQQVLERWQAGLPLDPFNDPEAAKEYMEAAGGAMLLGGPMGSYSSAAQTRQARQTPEGQNLLNGVNVGSTLDTLGQEEEDVTRPIEPAGGTRTSVVSEPDTGAPAGGLGGVDTSRVVSAEPDVGPADVGAGQRTSALSVDDFRNSYQELRQEALDLISLQRPTPADGQRLKLVQRDLNEIVDDNAGLIKDRELIKQLKNPMYDGLPVIDALASQQGGQARAMQGDMFGTNKGARMRQEGAAALAGGEVEGTIDKLNQQRARIQKKLDSGGFDENWAMGQAQKLGMTRGEAAKNARAIAEQYVQQAFADIDQALANLQRKPRAMQGDLFGDEQAKKDAADDMAARLDSVLQARELQKQLRDSGVDTDFDMTPVKEEPAPVETAPAVDQKGAPVRAPLVTTEHAQQTAEGSKIKGFFDAIQPQAESASEQERHKNSLNTAANTMLEFDVAKEGEKTSPGLKKMLDYLAKRVGGQEKLDALIAALQNASPETQSYLLEKAGLPDLTTRRGMDAFSNEVQTYADQVGGKSAGVQIPTKNVPSRVSGAIIPYREEITSTGVVTETRAPSAEGKPRRPNQRTTEKTHIIEDSKLRTAIRNIKQLLGAKGKLSPAQSAAITYLNNTGRESFGEALADVAYDLAYYEVDPKNNGANSTFYGEGGKYALLFKQWIEENLDQRTVDTLNELVEEHKQNAAENKKFEDAVTEYHSALDTYADTQRKAAEKRSNNKIRKAPKKVRIGDIEEVEPEKVISTKNLPTVQMVTEIHPQLRRMLADGKTKEVLEILANSKGNPYYAALAQRLLDTNLTAKTRLLDANVMETLSNDPEVKASIKARIGVLENIVTTLYPEDQQKTIIAGLRSTNLREVASALTTLRDTLSQNNAVPAQIESLESTLTLFNEQYAWIGKYDPATDEIVLRSGAGHLTNHVFLHEVLHAAASHLIDNADRLTGIQRQGYDRLVELYNYAKPILSQPEFANQLMDLHEFISEGLTNPVFQAQLRALAYKSAPVSLWNKFTEAVRKLFNVKPGYESNVLVETMLATDAMLAGPMSLEGLQPTGAKAMAGAKAPRQKVMRPGMPNQPSTIQRWMKARTWTEAQREFRSLAADLRPLALGALTLRQIGDLVNNRIPQVNNFIKVAEDFLSRKNSILKESGNIAKSWERLQAKDPEMSRQVGEVMAMATIKEVDPDKASTNQRNANQDLMNKWRALTPEAKEIYRNVRNFYSRRYSEYKQLMNRRIIQMRKLGVSEASITEIRNEFEKAKLKGPYFPLMRFGRFWYQVGRGTSREFYMFDSQAARDRHIEERLKQDPHLADTIGNKIGNDFKSQMDFHARESAFLKAVFAEVDNIDVEGLTPDEAASKKQELKDSYYQTYLANQPDRSMRNQFIHRQNVAGYSEDALRGFAASSFNMAYQLSRFQYSPEMFSQIEAARLQIKDRQDAATGYDPAVTRENDELRDYVGELNTRLNMMLNPPDVGKIPQFLSNVGFIWYLTAPASAIVNVLGGMMVGLPTLIGQQVKANPKMSYAEATIKSLGEMKTVAGQIMRTGFQVTRAEHVMDTELDFPSLDRSNKLTGIERAAYNKFVADGLIDITATYDQSGLAAGPTTSYTGAGHRAMVVLSKLFHNAERFNREVMAMSAFRTAMDKYKGQNLSDRAAFTKAIAEAKDVTNRSMFDYSSTNKPRYFQHPIARIVTQFKQFPQQMTFFLCQNLYNSIKGESPEVQREARARFVGTMGMAGIFSGVTGLWGSPP